MISSFDVSADRANWGVAGSSTGGTCAVDLTVMHPDLFTAFVDIEGDAGPDAGTTEQTITRLFGGSAAAWAALDPATSVARHGAAH
jgi:S-formylglutathione hydrolase FrmB